MARSYSPLPAWATPRSRVGERLFPALLLLPAAFRLNTPGRLNTPLLIACFLLGPFVLQQQNTSLGGLKR